MQNRSFEISNYISSKLGREKFNVFEYCSKEYGKDLAKRIIEKTGPLNLYHCSESEDTLTLAIEAFKKINNKIPLDDIKNLIFVSETNVYQFPGNGFLFASEDEEDLTDKIIKIISDIENLEKVRLKGIETVNTKYGWDEIGRLTKKAYQTL